MSGRKNTKNLIAIVLKGDAYCRRVSLVFASFGAAALLFLMFLVVVDVSLRYILGRPIPGATEGTELILPYIGFLALGYTLAMGSHVRVTLLLDLFPRRLWLGAEILNSLIGMTVFGILTYFGWLHFWESFVILEFMMAPIKLPWWVGKLAMPLGFFIMFLQFFFLLVHLDHPSKNKE